MGTLTTGLASGLLSGLLLAAAAPTYAESGTGSGDDLLLSFDRLDASGIPDLDAVGGSAVGRISSAAGGQVVAGPDRSAAGHSLRMERFRPDQAAHPAVVVVRPAVGVSDRTDPGRDAFVFGADFSLDRVAGVSATDNGDNLVQRGLVGGPQYKIQLDGGHPLCRVSGSEGAVVVRATERVEPEEWYRVRCRRAADAVILRVVDFVGSGREVTDYYETGTTGTLSYGNDDAPFSIGGKVDAHGDVVAGDSDQFNGLVDNVLFRHLD